MPVTTTVETLQHLLADLLRCAESLHSTYGDTPAMRRVLNDVEAIGNGIQRLRIDAEDLTAASAAAHCTPRAEMIRISDADYDVNFWRDVDHEGIGAQSLACARRYA